MLYVNDEPEGKFLYTETIKLYCVVLYFHLSSRLLHCAILIVYGSPKEQAWTYIYIM